MSLSQVAGRLDLDAACVAGVVGKGNVFHFDDLNRVADGAGFDGGINGSGPGVFESLVTGGFIIVDQFLVCSANLGDGGTDGVGAAEVLRLEDGGGAGGCLPAG